jgi:hypothetical protein
MAAKKITLHCDVPVRDIVCSAIRDYARAAYPQGGSECAQVARYTLLELADEIQAGINNESHAVEISRRPRAMVKAAFEYYFNRLDETEGATFNRQRQLFNELLGEQPLTFADLQAAAEEDRAG